MFHTRTFADESAHRVFSSTCQRSLEKRGGVQGYYTSATTILPRGERLPTDYGYGREILGNTTLVGILSSVLWG